MQVDRQTTFASALTRRGGLQYHPRPSTAAGGIWQIESTGGKHIMDEAACRACGHAPVTPILISKSRDAHGRSKGSARRLVLCPRCALVQLTGPARSQQHLGAGAARVRLCDASHNARRLAAEIISAQKLRPTSLVLAVGRHDEGLLPTYQSAGIPVLCLDEALGV